VSIFCFRIAQLRVNFAIMRYIDTDARAKARERWTSLLSRPGMPCQTLLRSL
jgi:hypothetical protein